MNNILLVGVGGCLGSILRYSVSLLTVFLFPTLSTLPLSTLCVNVTGSLLIGLLMGACPTNSWYYLCVVGFCGGFTTFSSFSLEMVTMLKNGAYLYATIFVLLNVLLSLAAVWIGFAINSKINI